ncbi:uncharacterized protein LOC119387284 isoform X2 [Rhipicephalus sanguineus]|nr:uncharacterized protein LOC119387284 isoform X2 [Rhipicephalus sanguineus]
MSAKACGLSSFASGAMDGGGTKGDGDGRTERIERYKKQRREELARHYMTKSVAASEENSTTTATKVKVAVKAAEPEPHGDKNAAPERKNVAPSVRMTRASRLRALSHAATTQGASAEQPSKPELPHRGERQSLRPLDLNDNIPARAQVFCGSSKAENKAVAVSPKPTVEKSPIKRKPPLAAARPSPPRASMGQLQSRRSGATCDTKPTHDEKSQAGHTVESQAKNIAPRVSPQSRGDKQSDAFDTFGEEDASCSSTLSGEEEPQATAFNKHCSALPDVPCNKGEPSSPKVFSVTFHTTSTSYLQPSDQQAPSSKRAVAKVRLPSDRVVTGTSCSPESPSKSTKPEALRPWTKSYSPVKQPPPTARASGTTVTSLNVPNERKPPASENLSTIIGSQEKLRLQAHPTPALDRILVGTESCGTVQASLGSSNLCSDLTSHVQSSARVGPPIKELGSHSTEKPSFQLEASEKSAGLFAEVGFDKKEASCEDEIIVEAKPEELKLQRKSERSASFSDSVHGILKANTREDDKPRHSILKNRSSSSEERDHSPELHSILKSKEDIAKPEDTAKPKPILKKHDDTGVHSEPKPILKRKSVDEDAEDRLKPILKNQQQRRWSHEHSPEKGDSIVVRRRSHSTELETKPVLSFAESAGSASAVRTGTEQNTESTRLPDCVVVDSTRLDLQGSVSVSKVVSCPPLDSNLGHRGTGLQADISPHRAVAEEVSLGSERPITLRSPPLAGFLSSTSSPEEKRYFRRNASCYKTQPVTASEIKATDNLESVRSFRNLVLKEASLSIFNKEPSPRQDQQAYSKKPEFPQPYSPPSKSTRLQRERRRTLPVTSEELEEAIKMDASGQKRVPSPAKTVDATKDDDALDPSKLSVAAKVSMFKKSGVLDAPRNGAERKRPARFTNIAERRLRSQTQPVTTEEVQLAAKEIKDQDKQPEVKEDDLSKMSLADKLKMFNQKVTLDVLTQKPPMRSNSMRRSLGSKSTAEPAAPAPATLGVPLSRVRSHSSPPEEPVQPATGTTPKGILKVQAGPQPVVKSILKQDQHQEAKEDVKGILKPEHVADVAPATPIKPILKPEKPSCRRGLPEKLGQ